MKNKLRRNRHLILLFFITMCFLLTTNLANFGSKSIQNSDSDEENVEVFIMEKDYQHDGNHTYDDMPKQTPRHSHEVHPKQDEAAHATNNWASLPNIRKYVRPLPGGGEAIYASKNSIVKIPQSLLLLDPKDWPDSHKIYYNLTYSPWLKDKKCSHLKTSFAPPGSVKPTALASFPSSGNTWLRYMIDCASGIFTGSMYNDETLARKGLLGESLKFDSGMTILQKTHGYTTGQKMFLNHQERIEFNHIEELGHRAVLVIRNPFQALISHRNLDWGGHTGYAPKSVFNNDDWEYFVGLKSQLWKDFYTDWIEMSPRQNIHVVFYERLKQNPSKTLRGILNFLSHPVDEARLTCIAEDSDRTFKRPKLREPQFTEEPFRKKLKGQIYEAIEQVDLVLRRAGHGSLPLEDYEYYDPEEAVAFRKDKSLGPQGS